MNICGVIIKSSVAVLSLFFLTKMLGKKQISQLNIFDYTIGISIGSIAADMSISKDYYVVDGVIAMVIYTLASLFVSYITMKSIKARRFLTGYPLVLLEDGRLIKNNLKRVKIDINDFLQECRINGYFDLSQIEYAIMEPNGRISFLPKSKYVPVTPSDMKLKVSYKGLTANLIIDGNIMKSNLKKIGKDEKWLLTRLEKNGYDRIDNLLLVICDSNEKLTIYEDNNDIDTLEILE